MKKGWSTGKIIGVILGSIAAIIILWVAFVVSLFQLVDFFDKIENSGYEDYEESDDDYDYDDYDYDDYDYDDYDYDYDHDDNKDNDLYSYDDSSEDEYYDFDNAIRNDLSYQVKLESYTKYDFISGEGKGQASLEFEYPVVSGDAPNIDGINQTLYKEIDIVEEHLSSAVELLSEGENYDYMGTCYVTYMSEEILSIAYVEYGYLDDRFLESYIISLNFDMQTGMVLSNTNLVDIDDNFSIDFRDRCERQNGKINGLSYMSDQEITSYLTDEDYLIIFYTPLGMEIGFNYYDGWVTVTYKDYERFTKQF